MEVLSLKKRRLYLLLLTISFFVTVPLIVMYASGYRLSSNFKVIKTGGIYVEVPISGASFYLDDKFKGSGYLFQKNFFVQDLLPSVYSVRIDRKGYQDWRKDFEVTPTRIVSGKALLLPEIPDLILISTSTQKSTSKDVFINQRKVSAVEYDKFITYFNATTTVGQAISEIGTSTILYKGATTTIMELGDIGLWKDAEGLQAWWIGDKDRFPYFFCRKDICSREILVAGNSSSINNFDFFPADNQFVIIEWPDGVFVTELDTRNPQNIQSLYPIRGARFRVIDNSIYILDGQRLFEMDI